MFFLIKCERKYKIGKQILLNSIKYIFENLVVNNHLFLLVIKIYKWLKQACHTHRLIN